MDDERLRNTISLLQLLLERPKFHSRRGSVEITEGELVRTVVVVADRWTGRWQVDTESGSREGGPGRLVPNEAAMLMPEHLPVWGRSHDMYSPTEVEKTDHGFLVIARATSHSDQVCEVHLDARFAIATNVIMSQNSLRLLQQSAVIG
jgi:hypothetical protein